jgi:hypothetical protein
MVTFGVDVYRRSETKASPLDGTLKDFELEGYEGIVKIQDRSRNQTILIPIGGTISVKEVNERALLCLKSIQDDLNNTIELIKGQI